MDVRRVQAADDRVSASEAAAASLEGEQIAAVMRESGRQSGYTVLITGSTKVHVPILLSPVFWCPIPLASHKQIP